VASISRVAVEMATRAQDGLGFCGYQAGEIRIATLRMVRRCREPAGIAIEADPGCFGGSTGRVSSVKSRRTTAAIPRQTRPPHGSAFTRSSQAM
jgi:hypothetical protein